MNTKKKNSGLTLVEIIIALAILGIISVSFLGMFSSAISSIYLMGNTSRTVAEAQAVLDKIYEEADRDNLNTSISEIMVSMGYEDDYEIVDLEDLNDAYKDKRYRIAWEEGVDLVEQESIQMVTVLMFYNNNQNTIRLSSPIPKLRL